MAKGKLLLGMVLGSAATYVAYKMLSQERREQLKDLVTDTAEDVRDRATDYAFYAADVLDDVKGKAGNYTADVKNKANNFAETVSNKTDDLASDFDNKTASIREQLSGVESPQFENEPDIVIDSHEVFDDDLESGADPDATKDKEKKE